MVRQDSHACQEYNDLSRRGFLASGGAAALALATAPSWLPRVALAKDHRSSQRDVIISVYLRGASDGLSLVPPWQENRYYQARPTLAVPRPDSAQGNRAIDLNGFFGLAPALNPLMNAYTNGHLLFVHACGSTNSTRSHFDGQKFMESGTDGDLLISTGWLGRHLYSVAPAMPGALLRAVGINSTLQRTLNGGPLSLPIPDLNNFGLTGEALTAPARRNSLLQHYDGPDELDIIARNTIATMDLLNTINFSGYVPAGGAVYPSGSFGNALKSAAALIKAQVGVEAIAIDNSGWDTHNDQGTTVGFLANLMGTLANGLAAFYKDMTAQAAPSFVLVAMSEFGRRLTENGSAGTDHGHGNVMMLMGQCIDGGQVKAIWPGLAEEQLFEGKDLAVTIDYRDVLAEIVQHRLGNSNLAYVFPDHAPTFRDVLVC